MTTPDIRTLGRVGAPLRSAPRPSRRRRRLPRVAATLFALLVVGVLWLAFTANRQLPSAPPPAAAAAIPPRPDQPVSRSAGAPRGPLPFAAADGLLLSLPGEATAVAFREADLAESLELLPVGSVHVNDVPEAFSPPASSPGPRYSVLASAGTGRPPTSAADVVLPQGTAVAAPVDGRVLRLVEYPLYGQTHDWRVELEPTNRPDLTVVVVHLADPQVAVGEVVRAGVTALGTVRVLPYASPVDAVAGGRSPHAHMEVIPAVAVAPLDPNVPATAATSTPEP